MASVFFGIAAIGIVLLRRDRCKKLQQLESESRDKTLEALQEVDDPNATFYTTEEVEEAMRLIQERINRQH